MTSIWNYFIPYSKKIKKPEYFCLEVFIFAFFYCLFVFVCKCLVAEYPGSSVIWIF